MQKKITENNVGSMDIWMDVECFLLIIISYSLSPMPLMNWGINRFSIEYHFFAAGDRQQLNLFPQISNKSMIGLYMYIMCMSVKQIYHVFHKLSTFGNFYIFIYLLL